MFVVAQPDARPFLTRDTLVWFLETQSKTKPSLLSRHELWHSSDIPGHTESMPKYVWEAQQATFLS